MTSEFTEIATQLSKLVRTVPNFPTPGILFRDITPILMDSVAFRGLIKAIASSVQKSGASMIVGIESRGFIIGVAVAYELSLPFIPARKAGKLPAETISTQYALEYGEQTLELHRDAISKGDHVAIVDDLLATGGTAKAAADLVTTLGGSVSGVFCAIELQDLPGRKTLAGIHVQSTLIF